MIASTSEPHWAPRPVLSLGVRLVQYGVPLLAGSLAAELVAKRLVGHLPSLGTIAAALTAAVLVSLLFSRLTLRLAPLAMLFKMTMIFPDHAPTRLRVARRSTSADDIRRRLSSPSADEQDAAVTMLALVTALGRHDKHTRGHSERVRLFCDLLSRELGLSEADSGRLRWAALIHDVGKLEVAVTVLNKPGRLNSTEWAQIRMHPQAGARLARPLAEWLGPWFAGIVEHHERFDGTGYPMGLAGDQISPSGRAVAVVDAYETMTAARSYKAAVTAVAARAELTRCAGTHFDPAMVRAFMGIALPRLLWSVGPLAFFVNLPFLRWVGDGGARLAQASSTAMNAASVSAVVVASGSLPALVTEPTELPVVQQQAHHKVETTKPAVTKHKGAKDTSKGGHASKPAARPTDVPVGGPDATTGSTVLPAADSTAQPASEPTSELTSEASPEPSATNSGIGDGSGGGRGHRGKDGSGSSGSGSSGSGSSGSSGRGGDSSGGDD
ncbi:HD-GYP domain-containing protein [Angustibacter sp. McL0619]|uniref:HD-GYP domain-containing protein n=1 Tax=Angustibacter sp. McL0619 TaxID=3415676 RepID=UPI003CEB07DD